MSAVKKPSSVSALRRGIGQPVSDASNTNPAVDAYGTPVGQMARPDMDKRDWERPPKPEKTRFTLDLDRDRHHFLKQHAVSLEADASQVLRALLDELREDPALAARVRDRIWPWT
jgi:hypothetical protein